MKHSLFKKAIVKTPPSCYNINQWRKSKGGHTAWHTDDR
nr:MAG TPA: hypothetical protein [Caudoviricetes sp.]